MNVAERFMLVTCARILKNYRTSGYQRFGANLSTMIQQASVAPIEGFVACFTNSQPLLRLLII
jgi:hypothetical protein